MTVDLTMDLTGIKERLPSRLVYALHIEADALHAQEHAHKSNINIDINRSVCWRLRYLVQLIKNMLFSISTFLFKAVMLSSTS